MKSKALLYALLVALFMPWAANAQTLTVCDGTENSDKVPFDGYNADDSQHNQMIFPATDLTAMVGKNITQMMFYIDQTASNGSNTAPERLGTWTVSLGETTETTLSGLDNTTALTQVYQGYFDCSTGTLTLAFDGDYTYNGGNLLVDLNHAAASWNRWYFLGVTATGASYTYNNQRNFLPKTTFSYEAPASTPKPTGLAVSNILHNEATLSWTENGTATSWQLCLNGDEDNLTTITTNPYTLTNLTPTTAYTAKVRSVGTGEYSAWSNEVSFSTTAVAEAVGDAWSDDFEGATCSWELINGTITNAWAWGTATNNGGTHALYISNDGGTTNAYTVSSAAMVYATKLLSFAEGKYEFTYDWNANGESTYDYLRVALVPASVTLTAGTSTPSGFGTSTLPTGWISLDGGNKLNLVTAWQNKSVALNVAAGNYYLVLAWRNDGSGGTQPPAAVDNVSITKIACDQDVTDLTVSNITTTGATLSWDGGEATQWQVAYGTSSNFEGATEEIVSTASYNMTGLTASTIYYVRVRAYCGGEDYGSWSNVLSFPTACDVIEALGYSENFDSYTTDNNVLPNCWNYINTTTYGYYQGYPKVYNYNSHSTSNCLYFYSYAYYYSGTTTYDPQPQYAILPEMNGLAGMQVTLWARGTSATSTFKIGTMSDPADATTFEAITEQALTTSYQEFEYIIPANAQGNYLAIMIDAADESRTSNGVYIDDIVISEAPSCLKPTYLTVTGVSTTTATLSWTAGGDETAWQICLNDDEDNLIMAQSNPFTVEGLTASTAYTVKVRAYCSEEDQSEWSNEVSFATECEAITDFPWTENFNNLTAGIPVCWDNSEGTTTNEANKWNYYATGHDGAGLRFNSYSNSNGFTNFLKTVSLSLPSDQPMQLSFWYKNPTGGDFSVYISTDGGATHETALSTGLTGVSTWTELVISLADYAGQEVVIVFKGTSNYGSGDAYIYLDDVTVMEVPSCVKPNDLEVTATTTTTATLSWTAGGDETAWQICLNDDEDNLIMAQSNPFTVEGLTASTAYTVKVRAYCSEEDQSEWSNEVNFATECEAIVVDAANPFTEGFEGTAFPPICWENIASGSYQWSRTTSSSYIHTGNGAAYSGYYGDIYLVMPDIQISSEAAGAQLSFWSYNTYTEDYDKNSVVLLDGENEIELWTPESVSQSWVETTIDLSAYVGRTISLAFKYEGNNANGWYVDDVQVKVTQTVTKEIAGYGDGDGSYYLIASPIDGGEEGVNPETINGMLTDEYDLYYFDEAGDDEGNEWMNYKVAPFNLKSGKGYLYASKNPTTLVFTGNPIEGTEYNVTLNKTEGADWSGWNLVGNPFNVTAYIDRSFYTLDEDGKEVIIANDNTIQPMEGVFVNANSDEEQMTFTTNAPLQGKKQIVLNLTHDRGNTIDRTIVRFGQSQMMPKFMLNENHTKMYIPKDNKEFAMVSGSNNGRLPVNFEPAEDGTYFINVDVENVRVKYLHLIDREMGMDVDLLQNPTYKFEAKTNEKPNRFELVFKTGSSQFKEVFSNISGDNFSFCNNGNWIINNDGDAILQVIDVNGQILSSERISGSVSKHIDATPGVYMLRLVNGENVKVQKIVIE